MLRKLIIWLVLVPMPLNGLWILSGIWSRAEAEAIRWYKNFGEAIAAAQKTNKPIMIDFWADWCAPCKLMEAEVYTDARVAAALAEKMVVLRLNFDYQKDLVRRYNVEAIPYLVFTTSHGTELLHQRGILGAKDVAQVIQALPADVSEFNRLDRILETDNSNFEALENMAARLRAAGFYQSSNGFYDSAIKRDAAKKNPAVRRAILGEMGLNALDLRDGKQAASIFERCIKEFPGTTDQPAFLLGLGRAYLLMEKRDEARKVLQSLIAGFPETESAERARRLLPDL